MAFIPPDYLHRVYAGILGKLVGVYLGRPFENWTYPQILQKLGPVHYYVHDKFNLPCVVIDDDVSGTFAFVRALEEHGSDSPLTSADVGRTWLNNVIEKRSIFWWGGNGISTEHTTYLNLKRGIPAPESGSIATNGLTVAEQIGAQIFIDGWAMVAPGNPNLAVELAEAAARVSHDGEAVHAAKLWAAMEAEAFVSKDVNHLLDLGLSYIPSNSAIARLVADIRGWAKIDNDWQRTRQQIEDRYGYDKYSGICHVIPNHGIMVMALLYGGHDFSHAMHIINTCGWDTDCNSGNLGCLVAIMHGLDAFEGQHDWRGPVADRALISSADNGYSINNAARLTYDIANLGMRLAGEKAYDVPKEQYHFSLPGSRQGFQLTDPARASLMWNEVDGHTGLMLTAERPPADEPIELMTDTFTPADVLTVSRHYELMASPLVYPGQQLVARVSAARTGGPFQVAIRLKAWSATDKLVTIDSPWVILDRSNTTSIEFTIPSSLQNQPVQSVGIAVLPATSTMETGSVWLHSLSWSGTPKLTIQRPPDPASDLHGTEHDLGPSFWERSFVSSVDKFHSQMGPSFYIAQDAGEGLVSHGTREWTDYQVMVHDFTINLGAPAGVAVRVQGLRRWYAVMFVEGGKLALVKARDEHRTELVSAAFDWRLDQKYQIEVRVEANSIKARVDNIRLEAIDDDYKGGAVGLVITEGSLSAESIDIGPITTW